MSILHQISGCDQPARKADVVFVHGLGGVAFGVRRRLAEADPSNKVGSGT